MDCQDWSEVKIGGGKIYNNKNKELPINIKQNNVQNLPGTKFLKKLEEDETVVIPKVSISVSKEIENKRNLCSITQKELANALNIPVNIIKELESGKGDNNKGLINKINNYLNKKIKNNNNNT